MPRMTPYTSGNRMVEKPAAKCIEAKQRLLDFLDSERKRKEDRWIAATAKMRSARVDDLTDRRISTKKHEPERRRR